MYIIKINIYIIQSKRYFLTGLQDVGSTRVLGQVIHRRAVILSRENTQSFKEHIQIILLLLLL